MYFVNSEILESKTGILYTHKTTGGQKIWTLVSDKVVNIKK